MTNSTTQPQINIHRTYLKGASVECPKGALVFNPGVFDKVGLNLDFNVNSTPLGGGVYEVAVRATATAKNPEDQILYVMEIEQAGIFQIEGANESQLSEILNIAGPSIILPYLRVQFSDFLLRAQLPQFHLPDINWAQHSEALKQVESTSAPKLH